LKIKTLKQSWSSFFTEHQDALAKVYPGLNLQRFLMEVGDILKKRNSDSVSLDDASDSISEKATADLVEVFLKGVPFQYLLEESEFFGHKFFVNKDVLIPRPETEYLVDLLVKEFKGKVTKVLDVGTGSGVILLSLLAANVGKSGVGVDISPEALEVAKINSKKFKLESKASLILSDRLDKVEGTFDLIVSNPPYIKASSHRSLVHDSVDEHEPHGALYLPDDYYAMWFEDFFAEIRGHLKGTFFMEGHELELDDQAKMLGRLGFQNIKVFNDMTGIKRYLRANI
jgi:release factor glutamine methyltransferase